MHYTAWYVIFVSKFSKSRDGKSWTYRAWLDETFAVRFVLRHQQVKIIIVLNIKAQYNGNRQDICGY